MSRIVNLIRNSLTQPDAPMADSCWSPKGLANSTSFSDFSLGTASEVESVMTNAPDVSPTSSVDSSHAFFARRMSCDYPQATPASQHETHGLFRASFDGRSGLWPRHLQDHERRRNVWIGNNAQADQVAHSAPVSAAAPPPIPKPPRQRKIDGLDFYEYVELIRSSSL
eukprot:jgi/Botrbrau1/3970/Bobra.0365s0043.1